MQVLLFQAIGMPDGSFVVPPAFTAEDIAISPPDVGPGDLEVELLDATGAVLVRHRVAIASPCAVPGGSDKRTEALPRLCQAVMAQHAKARVLRVSQWGRPIHERSVADAPVIDVAWPSAAALNADEVELSWSCADPEVHGLWQFSNDGRNWTPLCLPQPAGTVVVDMRALPGGNACSLRLLVADGVQTHRYVSMGFALRARGWVGMVLAPADGSRLAGEAEIELIGQGFEMEERQVEFDQLSWTSSLDGDLGSGHRRRVRLSAGQHQVTLAVRGRAARTVTVLVS